MHSPTSPVTPAEIIEAHLFGELPVRQGALSAEAIRAECPQFRILVIGKANAGKTTVLRKVCNAKPDAKPIIHDAEGNSIVYNAEGKEVQQEIPTKPRRFSLSKVFRRNKVPNPPNDVFNPSTERGKHDIEYQLTYPGSNFIFHDSRGIEAGSENELEMVKKFIWAREHNDELKNQLHVIWYCIPMDDQRPVSGAEKAFFTLGTGSVPVVVIFTKFDALEDMCYNKLRSQGKDHQEAEDAMPELAKTIFQNEYLSRVLTADFPPKAYICLAEMNKEENQCSELSEITMDILDNDVLVNLFVSTQKNNLDLCIKKSIEEIWEIDEITAKEIVGGLIPWFPNYWSSNDYKARLWDRHEGNLRAHAAWLLRQNLANAILKHLSLQFPFLFSQDESIAYQRTLKFQAIAVVALLAEHSFWISGTSFEEQFLHAVKSFKSQKHIDITLVMAEVKTAFKNARDKQGSAWLIQWIINNKLNHK